MKKKEVYLGIDDYKKLIKDNGYYVDKTLLIKEFFENKAEVTLITRPRRFGKTLNLTMMREFLDITKDSKDIFKDTKIMETEYSKKLNAVPIIFMSFKTCAGNNEKDLITSIKKVIKQEYARYKNIIFKGENNLYQTIVEEFEDIYKLLQGTDDDYDKLRRYLPGAIYTLTMVLSEYYNDNKEDYKIKPIIILDEYDNPFIEAKNGGYYEDVKDTLSTLFVTTFKGNEYMYRAIITGIQRIAHESIFSKFNNPSVCTVVDDVYTDKFGLTEEETKEYLEYFGYELNEDVKEYYNGYRFFETNVYNPMSITSYIAKKGTLQSYWSNSSSNTLIKEELPRAKKDFFDSFNEMIEKGKTKVRIDFATTFVEKQSTETLWGLLLNAGYITLVKSLQRGKYIVRIPNEECRIEFQKIIENYSNLPDVVLDVI